jgi:hypothetical protein
LTALTKALRDNPVQIDDAEKDPKCSSLYDAVVLYDFTATASDELTVQKDDIVAVKREENEWVSASFNGTSGLLPANFIQKLDMVANNILLTANVTFMFSSQRGDELTVSVGETVTILEKMDVDWWRVEKMDRSAVGLVPASFLQEVCPEEVSKTGRPIFIHIEKKELNIVIQDSPLM